MNKFKKLIKHIQNGTLIERVWGPVRKKLRNNRKKLWTRVTSRRSEFVFPIFPKVRIFLYKDCELSKCIHLKDFETDEIYFLSQYLRPGDRFIDIGSNFGYYSLIAARCIGPLGQVFAIEPTTKPFNRLVRNIKLNKFENITPIKIAIANKNGKLPMQVSKDGFDAWNSLAKPDSDGQFEIEEVETRKLDDLMTDYNLRSKIRMMKIDVEGWECELLKGGKKILGAEDAPLFQIEFNHRALVNAGYSSKELYTSLKALGFTLLQFNRKQNLLTELIYQGEELFTNVFAGKAPALEELRKHFKVELL